MGWFDKKNMCYYLRLKVVPAANVLYLLRRDLGILCPPRTTDGPIQSVY